MPTKQTWDPDQSSKHGHFVSDLGMQVSNGWRHGQKNGS
jgi:hypothetical protein